MHLEFGKIGTWLKAVEFLMCGFGLTQVVGRDLYLCHALVQQVISLEKLGCADKGV